MLLTQDRIATARGRSLKWVAKLADAEPGVEQGPDDAPFGGRLSGVGQRIRFVGNERFSHVLIRHLSPRNSCVLGIGTRNRCAFLLPCYPHRMGRGSGFRPRNKGYRHPGPIQGREAGVRDPSRKTQSKMLPFGVRPTARGNDRGLCGPPSPHKIPAGA